MRISKRVHSNNPISKNPPARKYTFESRGLQRSCITENLPPLRQPLNNSCVIPNLPPPPNPFDPSSRKYFDIKRWQCICRPQYSCSCGITTVVACWNYLFSNLGNGTLSYITVPEALKLLGYQQEIKRIPFLEIAINHNIMKWFRRLCEIYKVKGEAKIYWKKSMPDTNSETILKKYIKDIRDQNKTFIYHCYKHYLTPIGYEITPKNQCDAYTGVDKISLEENDYWMLIGESSKGYPGIHVIRWEDVEKDIMCENKMVYNIRQQYKGIQKNKDKVNYHRLILLEKID